MANAGNAVSLTASVVGSGAGPERHRHICVTGKIEEKEKTLFLAIPADAANVEGRGREWLMSIKILCQ